MKYSRYIHIHANLGDVGRLLHARTADEAVSQYVLELIQNLHIGCKYNN